MPQPAFEPLYVQVRSALVARLIAREWAPGELLPGELAIAAELGVSLGTVRKAVDSLVADGVLRRHQGKGTYVTEQTPERANYHFFRLVDAEGKRVLPEAGSETIAVLPTGPEAAQRLGIGTQDKVVLIDRVRSIGGRPAMLETVVVPAALMPGLETEGPLPNALYPHYQSRHGVSVISTEDRLSAAPAGPAAARALGVPQGTALLVSDRVAYDLAGRPVEWRRSQFLSDGLSYAVTLG
ncbi:MAG TPA: GntR family transcriptional regulator [Thermohalobaculum sp.]|nr:GntR family transcriptional regulator [Thermohalobaculum sp.]